ncbi:MAG: phosphoenolpyruvate synthase [Actinomycetota bacterium]|nr:phosphoenolpyruvate synthase [Actinomycetota bacterium]
MDAIRWFDEIGLGDTAQVGGKGANLGELTEAGLPVPPGFVVTGDAYLAALDHAGVRGRLRALLATARPDDIDELDRVATEAQALVRGVAVPPDLASAVLDAYHRLGTGISVAVRSSGIGEDAEGTSFAGMNATFTNVSGDEAVLTRLVDCWASLHGARALAYRASRDLTGEPTVAVVVQEMVPSERAGVMFTADPSNGDTSRLVIEAAFGQGEVVVSGQVEPDTYVVDKEGPRLVHVRVGTQSFEIVRGAAGTDTRVELSPEAGGARVLDDAEVLALARLGLAAESHYGAPQDTEWAMAGDRTVLVQSRPITTLAPAPPPPPQSGTPAGSAAPSGTGRVLVRGLAASTGRATGPVRVLASPDEGDRLEPGEILVAHVTSPDWVPAMRRAAALVTDGGGMTCHAAIVSRELGVPCVVGTRDATTVLRDGEVVTVDGARGLVTEGAVVAPTAAPVPAAPAAPASPVPLATRMYLNLAFAEHAEEAAELPADGVGLLRAEFMVTEALHGVHPRLLLERGEEKEFVDAMSTSLLTIARAFAPRPVVYRSIDFRTNEFSNLEGGARFEPVEANPMIGYRGCFRYVKEPDLFRLELDVLAAVREQSDNLVLMIPFVRTASELEACLDVVESSPVGGELPVWVMAEVPSVAYWIPRYASMGISGVSIGSNDLTQLMLGVDRDSEVCAELFDESDPAVLDAVDRIIGAASDAGITSSLCGQAPSNDPTFAAHLVEQGITSISVNPDALERTRRAVATAEWRMVVGAARDRGTTATPSRSAR